MNSKLRQQGYVLLALLLVFFVSGSSLMISAMNNRQSTALKEQQELHIQMAAAKAALLAYAANTPSLFENAIGPGYLPCPDTDINNNGVGPTTCTATATSQMLGRLPEYVLDSNGSKFSFNGYYADVDQQFWYAVSPYHLRETNEDFRNARNRTDANYNRLKLDGVDDIAALIIAPGSALATQDRASNQNLYSNYLDGTNGSSATDYFSAYSENPDAFNDTVIAITHDELMQVAGYSMVARLKAYLDAAHAGTSYPASCYLSGTQRVQLTYFNAIKHDWSDTEDFDLRSTSPYYSGYCPAPFVYYYRPSQTYYTRTSNDTATIYFQGCNLMTFQITYGGGITRVGDTCE